MQPNAARSVAELNTAVTQTVVISDKMPRARFGYALTADADVWDPIDADTRDDAARAAFELEIFVNEIFICEREPVPKARAFEFSVHVESMLDDADTAAYEHFNCGWHTGSIFAADRTALDALRARIVAACADWLGEHPGPELWSAANITTHVRSEASA